jgi:hypothetical protein
LCRAFPFRHQGRHQSIHRWLKCCLIWHFSLNLPIDVEHVLAAIVLAARNGQLDANTPLSSDESALADILAVHVKTVFARYGGNVGMDD